MARVLAVGAHFDDVEIGCGGTLLRHRAAGDAVRILVLTHSGYAEPSGLCREPAEARREGEVAAEWLGAELGCLDLPTLRLHVDPDLLAKLFDEVARYRPDRVYAHLLGDAHSDHDAAAAATLRASRAVPQVLSYRSNFQTPPAWQPNWFSDVSPFMAERLRLLGVFRSERRKLRQWHRNVIAAAHLDGATAGVRWAEGFVAHRLVER